MSQREKRDRIVMEDFNKDNQKIAAALGEYAVALETHAAWIAKLGNCQFSVTTYVGTETGGESNSSALNFSKKPRLMLISEKRYRLFYQPARG